jgi:hypothetical protein
MGQTSLEPAAAAAALSLVPKETFAVRSCCSRGELESCEVRETDDSEGDNKLVFLLCWGRGEAVVGGESV